MSLKSGFYNAVEIESGVYDRVYSADEYTNFYSAFLRDGVRRSGMDDLKCTAAGLVVTVGAGYAICGSKWVNNDTAATLPTITPPTGSYSRIDGVFLHVDTNEATRAASFVYRTGTPAETPQPPTKDTSAGVFELCLCYVAVAPNASSVAITDKRADSAVCGWITSPVGYDDYFLQFENEFNSYMTAAQAAFDTWFANARETLAVATLFKQYTQYIKTNAISTSSVEISIVQYDPTGVDILQVYCNGMLLIAGTDYTTSGTTITFTVAKVKDTEILIVVYKSIDGTGLGSVSDEVTQLQTDVTQLQGDVGALETAISGIIATEIRDSSNYAILGHQTATPSFVIEKEGYTPLAFGAIKINTDAADLSINSFYFNRVNNSWRANIGISNAAATTTYYSLSFKILYIKNI